MLDLLFHAIKYNREKEKNERDFLLYKEMMQKANEKKMSYWVNMIAEITTSDFQWNILKKDTKKNKIKGKSVYDDFSIHFHYEKGNGKIGIGFKGAWLEVISFNQKDDDIVLKYGNRISLWQKRYSQSIAQLLKSYTITIEELDGWK